MEFFFLTLFIFLFNFIIYLKFETISKNFIFIDKPDGKLKKHFKPTSLIGGLIILINLYLITFFLKLLNLNNSIFDDNFVYMLISLGTLFYIIGLIDDLKDLKPNKKLLFLIISIIFVIFLFPETKLEHIKISFLNQNYFFKYSFFFLILSFALLANAMNMFDGINLQLILFTFFVFIIFIIKGFIPAFFILFLICFIFLGLLNFQNQVFLGDGGAYLISAIIGCTFIFQYKNFDNFFYGDEVFIILVIPAIDMLRLFVIRLLNKKHPFRGDLNHLHHIVTRFTKNNTLTVLITISLCIFPTLLLFLNIKTYFVFIVTLIFYFGLIAYFKAKT